MGINPIHGLLVSIKPSKCVHVCTKHIILCFVFLSYNAGKTETLREKLCSILAQFEYQYRIQMWHDKGVDFKTFLYVPEIHPETGETFIEREDEAHVLKVCKF